MRVMLTGGTGFVGGHLVVSLLADGHEPHLLVRNPEKLGSLCQLHGLDSGDVSFSLGDITDEGSVRAALERCDACIHAAAVTSLDPFDRTRMHLINAGGAGNVLSAAVAAGCDPVIHVSSMGAIFPPTGKRMSSEDPVAEGGGAYPASKADAELHARALQADGAPVVIVYPGGVVGPKDVGVNAVEASVTAILEAPVDIQAPSGGFLLVDVRDLAAAITKMLGRRGPRRYVAGGNFVTWDRLACDLQAVTGISRPLVDVTEQELIAIYGRDTATYVLGLKPGDDEPVQQDTGVVWRSFTETLADLINWINSRKTSATSHPGSP